MPSCPPSSALLVTSLLRPARLSPAPEPHTPVPNTVFSCVLVKLLFILGLSSSVPCTPPTQPLSPPLFPWSSNLNALPTSPSWAPPPEVCCGSHKPQGCLCSSRGGCLSSVSPFDTCSCFAHLGSPTGMSLPCRPGRLSVWCTSVSSAPGAGHVLNPYLVCAGWRLGSVWAPRPGPRCVCGPRRGQHWPLEHRCAGAGPGPWPRF